MSYFRERLHQPKTAALMKQVRDIRAIITRTENEALLLESNLIKKLKPRYNIVFRDDKSYPYLYLSEQDTFPRLSYHRGPKRALGRYFGPYPNASAVQETLTLLQKLFRIRPCSNSFFSHRSRPCLQYQIKRCTAPCVGYINARDYAKDVRHVLLFLEGKSDTIIQELARKMEMASQRQAYEHAAFIRDQITCLREMQSRQYVTQAKGDIDVISVAHSGHLACILILYIRAGRLIGDKPYVIDIVAGMTEERILSDFLPQYYLRATHKADAPKRVLVSARLPDAPWIAAAISQAIGKSLRVIDTHKGKERKWLEMASRTAAHTLQTRLADQAHFYERFEKLQRGACIASAPWACGMLRCESHVWPVYGCSMCRIF